MGLAGILKPRQDFMEKLNIAFYTDTYLPAVDGVVASMLNFKGELERRGHNVYIFASGRKGQRGGRKLFLYPGVPLRPYPQYNVALFPYSSVSKLGDLKIDLIHAQTPFVMGFAALIASKIGRYPLASTFHTLINNRSIVDEYYPKSSSLKGFARKYLWLYTKFFYNHSNVTIAPTESVLRMLARYGISNTAVVPNSVDTRKYRPGIDGSGVRKLLQIGSREKVILYLGRISKEKRLNVMLKACKRLRLSNTKERLRFVIGGTGPAERYYKLMARRLGVQDMVQFIGFVDSKMLPGLYAAADAFCMPSTFETQGIVCLEAMACGKPVVGEDYLALSELIKNGKNGEKFAAGDYAGCARKIERVLNNPAAYTKAAVSTASEFSIGKTTDRLLDIYNNVLSEWAIN